jgi:lactoylglutathione lyase
MSLVKKLEFPDNKFDLYFFGYDSPNALSHIKSSFDRQGLIELTHNYGTEDDPEYKVNNGNQEPNRGFGHTCIAVDNIQAACQRIEDAGYKFQKKLSDGRMRNIAFVLDPDGYWVEVVARNDYKETEDVKETDVSTYTMVTHPSVPDFMGYAANELEPHYASCQRRREVSEVLRGCPRHDSTTHR